MIAQTGVTDASGQSLGTVERFAPLEKFHELVPSIATGITALVRQPVESLPSPLRDRLTEEHTRSLPAAVYFGEGLLAKDAGDYPKAREQLEKALQEDSDFDLARRELLALPAVLVSLAAVASSVESWALSGAEGSIAAPAERASDSIAQRAANDVPTEQTTGTSETSTDAAAQVAADEGMSTGTAALIGAGVVVGGAVAAGILFSDEIEDAFSSSDESSGSGLGVDCASASECESKRCEPTAGSVGRPVCCTNLGDPCDSAGPNCCGAGVACAAGTCCLPEGAPCEQGRQCCGGSCNDGSCSSGPPPPEPPPPPSAAPPSPAGLWKSERRV